MEKIVTVCTPTYNRANLLERPYRSLKKQINKNFVWLIIDDGSSDETEAMVNEFIEQANFEIKYVKKENGGRHTALNYSYNYIETEFVINLDSDDELKPDCIENLKKHIELIKDKKSIWQIVGMCVNQDDKLIGQKVDLSINELSGVKQRKYAQKYIFEKSCCRRTSVLKEHLFPIYNDTKFVTESTV